VLVVLHVSPGGTTVLPRILDRQGPLPVSAAEDGEQLHGGRVYVAPADVHLLVEDSTLRLWPGPRENGHRPAADPLFRSVAAAYGPAAVGVVLSGTRDDGTAGLWRIKQRGGRVLVQDPEEALYDGMPKSAIAHVDVDEVLAVEDLAARLAELARTRTERSMTDDNPINSPDPGDEATRQTCPDCGGVMHLNGDGGVVELRCSVGHAYSPDSFDEAQTRQVESALWAATRLLDDRSQFLLGMAQRAEAASHGRSAETYRFKGQEAAAQAEVLRELVQAATARRDV
jgi:two-component system chemotaxis response regulator CheB